MQGAAHNSPAKYQPKSLSVDKSREIEEYSVIERDEVLAETSVNPDDTGKQPPAAALWHAYSRQIRRQRDHTRNGQRLREREC